MNRREFIARAGAALAFVSAVAAASVRPKQHRMTYQNKCRLDYRNYDYCQDCGISAELIEDGWAPTCPPDWVAIAQRRHQALIESMRCTEREHYSNPLVTPEAFSEKMLEDLMRQILDNKELRSAVFSIHPTHFYFKTPLQKIEMPLTWSELPL